MDVQLNNGAFATNVTPMELKQLIEMGLVGKSSTTTDRTKMIPLKDCEFPGHAGITF